MTFRKDKWVLRKTDGKYNGFTICLFGDHANELLPGKGFMTIESFLILLGDSALGRWGIPGTQMTSAQNSFYATVAYYGTPSTTVFPIPRTVPANMVGT